MDIIRHYTAIKHGLKYLTLTILLPMQNLAQFYIKKLKGNSLS